MSFRLTSLALVAALVVASAHASAQNPTLRTAMRDKLAHTQRLLEAVVTADYAAVGRSAEALGKISDTEIIAWQDGAQPEYRRQAALFAFSVRGLRDAARRRNIDAVLAEFTTLVSSCTRCHAHVRGSRVIAFEIPSPVTGR
jgi:cytochrome c556